MSTSHHPSPDLIPEEMRNALAKFGEEAEQILTSFAISLESYQPRPIIYHYTDDVGLRGILESGRLWLTDIFSLNDPSELKHGLSLAVRILNEKAANGPEESKLFARDFGSLNEAIRRSAHYFVCSLSERGDDLGQWRAYADNGRGYALGFDAKAWKMPLPRTAKRRRRTEQCFQSHTKTPLSEIFTAASLKRCLTSYHCLEEKSCTQMPSCNMFCSYPYRSRRMRYMAGCFSNTKHTATKRSTASWRYTEPMLSRTSSLEVALTPS